VLEERLKLLKSSAPLFAVGELLNIPEVMNASDVVLGMASTCQQGLACGRPVIVLGERGFSAVVEPGNFDFLAAHHFNLHQQVNGEQPEALCQQMEGILSSSSQAERLGAFGREIACEQFDSQIGAQQLEKVYQRLLERAPPRPTERLTVWMDFFLSLGSLYAHKFRERLGR
jgi:glycosyltransferase involved in cell wall biosynthesis